VNWLGYTPTVESVHFTVKEGIGNGQ
jgi:hypothetical protein